MQPIGLPEPSNTPAPTWTEPNDGRNEPSTPNAQPHVIPTVTLADPTNVLARWERGILTLVGLGMLGVLLVAYRLNPYEADGQPRLYGTHEQLGLPPCGFFRTTRLPCPSCGLTTSFSLCMHGDLQAAWRAHSAGPILVFVCIFGGMWFLMAAWTGQRCGLPSWHWLSTVAAWAILLLVLGAWTGRLIAIFLLGGQ
ncbi:MAG: DUF2752 domain-containing protein [Gemmatales bacterium]|nr:DUF2752 domain-containing protein [Gemmatales bacterium]MDW7994335.1 DUF2752 domain-containing protein [Gemmatales bacterium]